MQKYIIIICIAVLLFGCSVKPNYDILNSYVPGTGIINGQGFEGEDVLLVPATPYFIKAVRSIIYRGDCAKRFNGLVLIYKLPEYIVDLEPKYQKLVRVSECDEDGKFVIKDVAIGEYYLFTNMSFMKGDTLHANGLAKKIEVNGGIQNIILSEGDII